MKIAKDMSVDKKILVNLWGCSNNHIDFILDKVDL
tara:strand:+ start:1764 stop:1868 length:105 start_codon:yes stop_codon:yes gene_type:complete